VHTYKPKLVFLSETRQRNKYVSSLRWRLGLKHCITHAGIGKGAGIALYYDESVEVIKLAVGLRYIDVLIRLNPHGQQWRATFVYGEAKAHERHHMWNLLRRIKPASNAPWLVIGDFNETMWQTEHFSSCYRSERNMANFREVLSDCELYDLGFKGPPWTYDNKQDGQRNVKARLDRGVASSSWSDIFQDASVEHICSTRSDHLPLLVRFGPRLEWRPMNEKRIQAFRYEYMWERVESLSNHIAGSWQKEGTAISLEKLGAKLVTMQSDLRQWAARDFGSILKDTAAVRKKLSELWMAPPALPCTNRAISKNCLRNWTSFC
jgi:hypothetical protein